MDESFIAFLYIAHIWVITDVGSGEEIRTHLFILIGITRTNPFVQIHKI